MLLFTFNVETSDTLFFVLYLWADGCCGRHVGLGTLGDLLKMGFLGVTEGPILLWTWSHLIIVA